MKENLPKGMGGISFEERGKEPFYKYLIHVFSIDNVNSVEDEIKAINSYWGNEYRLNKLNQLREDKCNVK